MSAWLELHTVLSLRLDAREAYRLMHNYRDEELAKEKATPLVVSRFDVAMEPAVEEEPVLTIGAIAEDGRPVALLLDVEDRAKVARWLAPEAADGQAYDGELAMLRGFVRTLRVAARQDDLPAMQQALIHHTTDDAEAREKSSRPTADATPAGLADVVYEAVSSFQIDRHKPGGYDQQLTAHVVAALVEWGEVR